MFTGLVEYVGQVRAAGATAAGRRIEVDLGPLAADVKLGDSIAIDGCCQTVAALRGAVAAFDAVPETLRLTTLGDLASGVAVNLERSLAAGDRLGGHFVLGHVDGTARLSERRETGGEAVWAFEADKSLTDQMIPKGSITVAGVSLTLVEVTSAAFRVALIPTTLGETTLGRLAAGSRVNIETDVLGKYVLKALSGAAGKGLTLDTLRDAGFLE
jgi:riboflavin synthase